MGTHRKKRESTILLSKFLDEKNGLDNDSL